MSTPDDDAKAKAAAEHAGRAEALAALRPLVVAEDTRMTNLNTRAMSVITATSVITALAAFFAKDAVGGGVLKALGESRDATIWLLFLALVLLCSTVGMGVYTLLPRSRGLVEPDGLDGWAKGQPTATEQYIRRQSLSDGAKYLRLLREFNASKIKRLRITYYLYAAAVIVIAFDAGLYFESGFNLPMPK